MSSKPTKMFSVFLSLIIFWSQQVSIAASQTNASNNLQPSLDEIIKLSSQQISDLAEKYNYDKGKIDGKVKEIENSLKSEKEQIKKIQKDAETKTKIAEKKLKNVPQSVSDTKAVTDRQNIKCEIVAIKQEAAKQIVTSTEKQIAYDVSNSKLILLRDWKDTATEINRKIKDGTISKRTLGDSKTQIGNVLDIGARSSESPFSGQEKDIQLGADELKRLKMTGEFPKEITDPVITEYVNRLAQNLGRNSDLTVPLTIMVVSENEKRNGRLVLDKDGQKKQVVNAFAMPGGFLVVYAGLILESENESEVAGVLAHEIAHVTARHGHRIMSRASKFGILETIGKLATLFIPMSYLVYILLQYGFNGLDLFLNLNLLGISRDFELEADQLGMQYVWHTGYDPAGFTNFFDRMASELGYASHTSFFQTHPAFGERIIVAKKEERALRSVDPNREYTANTSEFDGIKDRTRKLVYAENFIEDENDKNNPKPSLYAKERKEEEACKDIHPIAPPLSSVKSMPDTPPVTSIPKTEEKTQPKEEQNEEDKPPVLKRKD